MDPDNIDYEKIKKKLGNKRMGEVHFISCIVLTLYGRRGTDARPRS